MRVTTTNLKKSFLFADVRNVKAPQKCGALALYYTKTGKNRGCKLLHLRFYLTSYLRYVVQIGLERSLLTLTPTSNCSATIGKTVSLNCGVQTVKVCIVGRFKNDIVCINISNFTARNVFY